MNILWKRHLRKSIDLVLSDPALMVTIFDESNWLRNEIEYQISLHITSNDYFVSKLRRGITYREVSEIYTEAYRNGKIIYREPPFIGADIIELFVKNQWIQEMPDLSKESLVFLFKKHAEGIAGRFLDTAFYIDLDFLESYIIEHGF